jgi:hypothetical protein
VGQVGLELTTGRLWGAWPNAPDALAALKARVIALMALVALGLTEMPVHEPVHGRRQAIAAAVTQRSGLGLPPYSDGHLTFWLGAIRDGVHLALPN